MIISALEVLHSNAGYYVGRTCEENGMWEPYSRESGYFRTYEEADEHLKSLKSQA